MHRRDARMFIAAYGRGARHHALELAATARADGREDDAQYFDLIVAEIERLAKDGRR